MSFVLLLYSLNHSFWHLFKYWETRVSFFDTLTPIQWTFCKYVALWNVLQAPQSTEEQLK